jgi:hypothetical protein
MKRAEKAIKLPTNMRSTEQARGGFRTRLQLETAPRGSLADM